MDFQRLEQSTKLQYAVVIGILLVITLVIQLVGIWGDVDHYWKNINDVVIEHCMPYSETMFEYPPLALVVFAIPRALSWNLDSFHIVYALFAGATYVAGMYYTYKIADFYNNDRKMVFLFVCLITICMNVFIVARYDVFPTTMILIAIWKYINKKYTVAFAIIAVATMIKLYPALVAIAFLYPFLARRDWKSIVKQILLCAIICIAVEVPFIIYDSASAFDWVSYHSDRGIQVESVIGSVFEVINYAVPGFITVVFNFGSDNITGTVPDAIAGYMNIVLALGLIAIIIIAAYDALKIKHDEEKLQKNSLVLCIILILAFIVFNKVYSGQYGLWFLTLVPVLLFGSNNKKDNTLVIRISSLVGAASFAAVGGYGVSYLLYDCYDPMTIAPLLELIKNILTVIIFAVMVRLFLQSKVKPSEGVSE